MENPCAGPVRLIGAIGLDDDDEIFREVSEGQGGCFRKHMRSCFFVKVYFSATQNRFKIKNVN